MAEIFNPENIFTLGMLILLQAVLGFDNLLYIALESQRVEKSKQSFVRQMGIIGAIGLRIILLFLLVNAVQKFQEPIFSIDWGNWVKGTFNFHAIIVLLGGLFILYTAMKEITHMLIIEDFHEDMNKPKSSVTKAIILIAIMNLVFSFDSILSAMALTKVFWVMATAIILSGILMLWLSDHVAEFLERNRMYEVLGLFILFIVGILLLSEGGHLAHLSFFGYPIEKMNVATFYFVIAAIVLTEVVQGRYQKKILTERAVKQKANKDDRVA